MSKRNLLKDNYGVNQHLAKRVSTQTERYGNTEKENLNDLFPSVEISNVLPALSDECKVSDHSRKNNRKLEIFSQLDLMAERVKYLTETLKGLPKEVQELYNKPILKISENLENEEQTDLLNRFNSYKLPISEREQLELLERDLRMDDSFNIFFVSYDFKSSFWAEIMVEA